jgi:hypothetical protein
MGTATLTEAMGLTRALIRVLPEVTIGCGVYKLQVPKHFDRPEWDDEVVPVIEVVAAMPGETDIHAPPRLLGIGDLPQEGLVCAVDEYLKPTEWPR